MARLAKELNGAAVKPNATTRSFFTFLVDDLDSLKVKLTELAKQQSITIPLTVPVPERGIQSYSVPDDVWVAAIAYKGKKAVDTMVFKKDEFDATAVDKIVALAK